MPTPRTPTCMFWWVVDTHHRNGRFMLGMDGDQAASLTQEQAEAQAQETAPDGATVQSVRTLPYPSEGVSADVLPPHGFPGFCMHPQRCAGSTSCPRRTRSCCS